MGYSYLADVVVALHVAYVSFVVLGQLAIMIGAVLKWKWVRNPWFRITHLVAIAIVAVEAFLNQPCPLTVWEDHLRTLAGQEVTGETFIGRCLHNLIFYNVEFDAPILVGFHIGFAFLVVATFLLVPPRRPRLHLGT